MQKFTEDGFTFDDVLLVPLYSEVESRKNVIVKSFLYPGKELNFPIISANMDTITEADMAIKLISAGAFGILHRFYKSEESYIKDITKVYKATNILSFSIGTNNEDKTLLKAIYYSFPTVDAIVTVDIAHGYSIHMKNMIEHIKSNYPNYKIIAGNIATTGAALELIKWGADALKIGIGPGSNCTTRIVTGCGYPQLSAILNIHNALKEKNLRNSVTLIADGGIKNSGDIVKALAAGADSVMTGSLFAGTIETPGDVYEYENDKKYKVYRGMASKDTQIARGKPNDINSVTPEGISRFVEFHNISALEILKNLIGGIQSGMSYCGTSNIQDLQNFAKFVRITPSSYKEGTPHGLFKT